jgi:hypothetical protein
VDTFDDPEARARRLQRAKDPGWDQLALDVLGRVRA